MAASTGSDRIESRADLVRFLDADAAAAGAGRWDRWIGPQYRFLALLRLAEWATNCLSSLPGKALGVALRRLALQRGIALGYTIPPGVAGPGLALPHWGSLVIHPSVRLGAGCCLYVGVTLGMSDEGTPRIGERVYIGAGAAVFGPVEIGDDCVIGANATVNSSFPASTVIVGSPARAAGTARGWPS